MLDPIPFASFVGMTFAAVIRSAILSDDSIFFESTDGRVFEMFHDQDCCESVKIDDICGELEWLVGSPVLTAEEVINDPDAPNGVMPEYYTWTFYRISTAKGMVVIRWYGESNGYYSESVDIREITRS